nr:MAG TPA_asm: Proline/betaine transporter, CYTOPLASMIC, COILED-COIL, ANTIPARALLEL, TWO-STRANDED [Caudoviricetes sp.]
MNTALDRKRQIVIEFREQAGKLNAQYETIESRIQDMEQQLKDIEQDRNALLGEITKGPEPDEAKQEHNAIELRRFSFLLRFTKMQLEKLNYLKIQTDREREALRDMIRNLKEGIF